MEDRSITQNAHVDEEIEDATEYGEFISTYFAWVSLKEQKIKTEKLENIEEKSK